MRALDDVTSLGSALLLALLSASWAGPAWAYNVRPACPPAATTEYFVPPGILEPDRPDIDAFTRAWYSKQLRVMGEPSLSCGQMVDAEIYRFTWLRTFHRPFAVRIIRDSAGVRLVATELTGAGGYDPGTVATRKEKGISDADWQVLSAALSKTSFWSMPTRPPTPTLGLDGSQWIVEGRRSSRQYHIVDRWTPRPGAYRDAGLVFLTLAGISVEGSDLY
jgi:hypothetical protein